MKLETASTRKKLESNAGDGTASNPPAGDPEISSTGGMVREFPTGGSWGAGSTGGLVTPSRNAGDLSTGLGVWAPGRCGTGRTRSMCYEQLRQILHREYARVLHPGERADLRIGVWWSLGGADAFWRSTINRYRVFVSEQ